MTALTTFDLPPLLCSQGGFPYNEAHIEFWRTRARELEAEIVRLTDPPNPPLTMNDALALLAAQVREIGRLEAERDGYKEIADRNEALNPPASGTEDGPTFDR